LDKNTQHIDNKELSENTETETVHNTVHNFTKQPTLLPFEQPKEQENQLQTMAENMSYNPDKEQSIREIVEILRNKKSENFCFGLLRQLKQISNDD